MQEKKLLMSYTIGIRTWSKRDVYIFIIFQYILNKLFHIVSALLIS